MDITGKRIIVTGGASGIAAAAVAAFTRAGAAVVSVDVTDTAGEAVAAAATAAGPGTATFRHCDISRRDDVTAVFADAAGILGGLDALVNVAGVELGAPAEEITDDAWNRTIAVNLTGTFITNQVAFTHLRDHGGCIVNFASGAGLYPYLNGAHYSASKGGVISWTRTIAHEWGKYGIRAVAVNPAIWTPMYEESRSRYSPDALREHDAGMLKRIPLGGKLGDPTDDMAPVLIFLVSDAARFVTGQIVSVDGGMVPLR